VIDYNIAQDFAKMSVDPCDENVSLESLLKRSDQLRTDMENIHLKTAADKKTYTVSALLYIVETPLSRMPASIEKSLKLVVCLVETSRFPGIEELSMDEFGSHILSDQDPEIKILIISLCLWKLGERWAYKVSVNMLIMFQYLELI
jgi:hypothetical protein